MSKASSAARNRVAEGGKLGRTNSNSQYNHTPAARSAPLFMSGSSQYTRHGCFFISLQAVLGCAPGVGVGSTHCPSVYSTPLPKQHITMLIVLNFIYVQMRHSCTRVLKFLSLRIFPYTASRHNTERCMADMYVSGYW